MFAPTDGAITCVPTTLARSRDRCSGRRKTRVRGDDVLGYLRGPLRLGFGISRQEDGDWPTVDLVDYLGAWSFQP